MPYGKKYAWHMPFDKGLGQWDSTLCQMARSNSGTCLLARARGNAIVYIQVGCLWYRTRYAIMWLSISNNTYSDIEVPTLLYWSASISEPNIEIPDVDIDVSSISTFFFGNHNIEYGYINIEAIVFNIEKNFDIVVFNININVDIGGDKQAWGSRWVAARLGPLLQWPGREASSGHRR